MPNLPGMMLEKKRVDQGPAILLVVAFILYASLDAFGLSLNFEAVTIYLFKAVLLSLVLLVFLKLIGSLPGDNAFKSSAFKPEAETIIAAMFHQNDPLLILRFFAAFCVFTTHAVILLHPKPGIRGHEIVIGCAHTGMAVFFTISGYLMGKAFVRKRYEFSKTGILNFYKNRFIRIAPLAFTAFLLYAVFLYPKVLIENFLASWRIWLFHFYGSNSPYSLDGIGALWSLTVEMQYYFIAPFIYFVMNGLLQRKRDIAFFIVSCIGFVYVNNHIALHFLNGNSIFFSLLGQLPYFLIGYSCNYIGRRWTKELPPITETQFHLCTVLLLVVLGEFFLLATRMQSRTYYPTLICASLFTGVLIIALEKFKALAKPYAGGINLYSILQSFGVLSYGFYVWHSGVGSVYYKSVLPACSGLGVYLFNFARLGVITLALSFWSYCFVEKHYDNKKMPHY